MRIRIDFADKETLFVGANNSGKTSAMTALGHFLVNHHRFTVNDFTLSNWEKINEIGAIWEKANKVGGEFSPSLKEWEKQIPIMDVWLEVGKNEIHYVSHLLPSLDWVEGKIGVRLRYEPTDPKVLYSEYIEARHHAERTLQAAKEANDKKKGTDKKEDYKLSLWPKSMMDFLERKLNKHFSVKAYILDPDKLKNITEGGAALPQDISDESIAIEEPPFKGLIRIDEINAQRGFFDPQNSKDDDDGAITGGKYKLSEQMRSYYNKHIDPTEFPEPQDVDALQAIEYAQDLFDKKLKVDFANPILELEDLGYPGVTDPRVVIATKIRPIEGLNHRAALQYEIHKNNGQEESSPLRLPEQYNGLGYQNLISIVFRLMSFRDGWMRVGKAQSNDNKDHISPLHLVIVEEPEAHLHVQVQQVFIRIAYKMLRKHPDLQDNKRLKTQLVVSTHSSHVAHECNFASLRYFRRFPAMNLGDVPTTTVINLSEVFGKEDKTERFVTRYLKTTHCDLFFADAAILVEGPAERMLVPYFIAHFHPKLRQSYLTLLEIGGSHAHTLRPLIEHLGLTTLIITDLDSQDKTSKASVLPSRSGSQITNNDTLKNWIPGLTDISALLDATADQKETKAASNLSCIKVAYQSPVKLKLSGDAEAKEVFPYTFEDTLVLQNIDLFKNLDGVGLIKKFKEEVTSQTTASSLSQALFDALKNTNQKAKFSLDLLYELEPENFIVPLYIQEGLEWLAVQLDKKALEVIPISTVVVKASKGKAAA